MAPPKANRAIPDVLRLGSKTSILPIVHGSGHFSQIVSEWLLEKNFDCVAIPLPPSFQQSVERAILNLPRPSVVIQRSLLLDSPYSNSLQSEDVDGATGSSEPLQVNYVPIDPCQGVISAIRAAMGEHVPRVFIDLETEPFIPFAASVPDPYAVREVTPEKYAAALLPAIPRPAAKQTWDRIDHMARRLRILEQKHQQILLVTSVLHWPWIRDLHTKYENRDLADLTKQDAEHAFSESVSTKTYSVDSNTHSFWLGEIPFITSLYERQRIELLDSENTQIDGVKELLLAARNAYQSDLGKRGRRITPTHLSKCLQYIRNLSLIQRRLSPDLVTIVTACQQILGDEFALQVAEIAKHYHYSEHGLLEDDSEESVTFGIEHARLPDGQIAKAVSRLPNPPVIWKTLELQRKPSQKQKRDWQYKWNPYSQCSYPPEDHRIENFRSRVFDRAKAIIGSDLARTEKFSTSLKDGIDIRDTLRHWHEKEIYVRVNPPNRGTLDACIMLFDSPADPRDYPWRTTWFAEHEEESTLAFFATHYADEMVGPGIGVGTYGGALFLYPPIPIKDVWSDHRLDYTTTLEERLIAAACFHSRGTEIALVSALPPGSGWRKLAKRHQKRIVHVPLSSFGDESVQQLRRVHVLNGKEVRSYAEEFIRRP